MAVMKCIKIAEAPNRAIDWLVAKAEGHQWRCPWILQNEGYTAWTSYEKGWGNPTPEYTTDPAQAWPIMDRENITIIRADDAYEVDSKGFTTTKRIPQWFAETSRWVGHTTTTSYEGENMEPTFMIAEAGGYYGPTGLIAAMRAYCVKVYGAEAEVPEELLDT